MLAQVTHRTHETAGAWKPAVVNHGTVWMENRADSVVAQGFPEVTWSRPPFYGWGNPVQGVSSLVVGAQLVGVG